MIILNVAQIISQFTTEIRSKFQKNVIYFWIFPKIMPQLYILPQSGVCALHNFDFWNSLMCWTSFIRFCSKTCQNSDLIAYVYTMVVRGYQTFLQQVPIYQIVFKAQTQAVHVKTKMNLDKSEESNQYLIWKSILK